MTGATSTPVFTPRWTWLLWVLFGAGVMLLMRHGLSGRASEPMSLFFLLGSPLIAGALTFYGARKFSPSWLFTVFAPWLTVVVMLLGAVATSMEGWICVAILTPLFLVLGSVGSVMMRVMLMLFKKDHQGLQAVALLPFLLYAVDHTRPMETRVMEVHRSVDVAASPKIIYDNILDARNIKADELPWSLSHSIGVPKPVEGVNVMTQTGEVRFSKWERGVNFEGVVTDKVPEKTIAWRYAFNGHSFPEGSMDEHVAIGGRYFDLIDTRFRLTPTGNTTRLEIIAHYRVTTPINTYAVPVAELLGRDFVDTILGLYKHRSEHPVAA